MTFSKLTYQRNSASRPLEFSDLRAALRRMFFSIWNVSAPIETIRFTKGRLTVRVPSFPWRTEVLWKFDTIRKKLKEELPQYPSLTRITVLVGGVRSNLNTTS